MTERPDRAFAPWVDAEVESLNAFQNAGVMHPFTCGNDSRHEVLHATAGGWECPSCDYRQDWAHEWMADGSWREVFRDRPFSLQPGRT